MVTSRPKAFRSSKATRALMTPSCSSCWMRRQHVVVDNFNCDATSATDSAPFLCRTSSNRRSSRSRAGRLERSINCRKSECTYRIITAPPNECNIGPRTDVNWGLAARIGGEFMKNRSRLHVPKAPARPGEAPDFSYVHLSPAGAISRPDINARARDIAFLSTELVRVLDDAGTAVGPWHPHLDPSDLQIGLRHMLLTRIFDDRMQRTQRA